MMDTYVLLFLLISSTTLAQRGCPSEGCDSRGFNCQTDFQVNSTKAQIVWRLDIGKDGPIDAVKTLGCVGNDANVICKLWSEKSKGYVSVDALTGEARWYDTLLTNPRLPIMDTNGNIIATDGQYIEVRMSDGGIAAKIKNFLGSVNETSSIHYVHDANMFFFVSYQTGGIYLYHTLNTYLASTYLDVKDPVTNKTVSVWKPISKLVINTGLSTPCTYFIAQNNVTMKYRIYAVSLNRQPPYLLEKWHIDFTPSFHEKSDILESRLLTTEYNLIVAMGESHPSVLIIENDKGTIISTLDMCTIGVSRFGYPRTNPREAHQETEALSLIWLSSINSGGEAVITGWSVFTSNTSYEYRINLSELYGFDLSSLTSEIMVFRYDLEDTTLVFGFSGLNFPDENKAEENKTGSYLMAMKPQPGGNGFDVLWNIFVHDVNNVVGQIIGVHNSTLVATVDGYHSDNYVIGVKLGD